MGTKAPNQPLQHGPVPRRYFTRLQARLQRECAARDAEGITDAAGKDQLARPKPEPEKEPDDRIEARSTLGDRGWEKTEETVTSGNEKKESSSRESEHVARKTESEIATAGAAG